MTAEDRQVLLVDDDPKDVELTLRAFRRSDIPSEIVVRNDGPAAIEYLFATADADPRRLPALVLLDIKLPRMDGFEVLRRIRSDPRTQRLPVVLLSSSSEERDRAAGYELGANGYVRKSVDFARFVESVRALSAYWLGVNEPAAP